MVIIKLDFEKAFDKVEHNAIVQIMEALGFGENWVRWVKDLFTSATSQSCSMGCQAKQYIAKGE
jgi:hypothetical protein